MKKLFPFSVEIPQQPSKNIYSVLAFINILLKTARTTKEKSVKHSGGEGSTKNFPALKV